MQQQTVLTDADGNAASNNGAPESAALQAYQQQTYYQSEGGQLALASQGSPRRSVSPTNT